MPSRQNFSSTCRSEEVSFEHNLEFLKEETIFEISGLDVHPWLTGTTEQHTNNLLDQLNPRNKPVQDSLGTLSCICTLQESFTSTGLFAHNIISPSTYKWDGHDYMTLLLENPDMNFDFSNLLLSCASALSNTYILSKAVNEIKLPQKLVCSSFWKKNWELLCLCSKQQGQRPRTLHQKHYENVYFPWEAEECDFLKTPFCSLVEETKSTPALTITGRCLHSGSTDLDLKGTLFI